MKKIIALVSLLALLLVGCSDASATIKDGKEAIFTIGSYSYTKKDLYDEMVAADQASSIISEAIRVINNLEVTVTDQIKEAAQKKLDEYKEELGDEFEEALPQLGCKTEEDLYNLCLSNEMHNQLIIDYINANYDDLYNKYAPFTAQILFFDGSSSTAEEALANAQKALETVKEGKETFALIGVPYKCDASLADENIYFATDSSLDYNVLTWINSQNTPGISDVITNKNGNGYYIVKINNKSNATQIKDLFVDKLSQDSSFIKEVNQIYFKKYNFTVYDIDVFNDIKSNYPTYLVQ